MDHAHLRLQPHGAQPFHRGAFRYDSNVNTASRLDCGRYAETFDVETRLAMVTDTQTLSATRFEYNGDGERVLTVYPDGSQAAVVGDHYEVEGDTTRSYYFPSAWLRTGFASLRVAMRVDDGASEEVYWFHTDDPSTALRTSLGSTSLLSDEAGDAAPGSEARFLPYGEYRVEPTADLTDHGFTGHKQQDEVGLIFMRARFYLPGVGRFLSADTIVTDPIVPESLNRYSYTAGNPVKLVDPSGHIACVVGEGKCHNPLSFAPIKLGTTGSRFLDWVGGQIISFGCSLLVSGACEVSDGYLQPSRDLEYSQNAFSQMVLGVVSPIGMPAGSIGRWGRNYLKNYDDLYQVTRQADHQIHHVIPQRFQDIMEAVGVNVHDPDLLREVPIYDDLTGELIHQRLYTDVWEEWLENLGRSPTAEEVVRFAQQLEQRYYLEGTLFYREGNGLPGLVDWDSVLQI